MLQKTLLGNREIYLNKKQAEKTLINFHNQYKEYDWLIDRIDVLEKKQR